MLNLQEKHITEFQARRDRRRKGLSARLERIMDEGPVTIKELVERTGSHRSELAALQEKRYISIPSFREQVADYIKEERAKKRPKFLYQLRLSLDLLPSTFYEYCQVADVSFAEETELDQQRILSIKRSLSKASVKTRKIFDLALKGMNTAAIGRKVNWTPEFVRQNIAGLGIYSNWRAKIKEKLEIRRQEKIAEKNRGRLAIEASLREEDLPLPVRKAYEYKLSSPYRRSKRAPTHNTLVKLFSTYYCAVDEERILSLKELAHSAGIKHASQAGKILDRVGLNPFFINVKEGTTSKDKRQALKDLWREGRLSKRDMVLFSGLSESTVRNLIADSGKRFIHCLYFGRGGGNKYLDYSLASRIYAYEDRGISKDKITKKLGIPLEFVKIAEEGRDEIEPVILSALRNLFPGEKVKRPYRTFALNDNKYK